MEPVIDNMVNASREVLMRKLGVLFFVLILSVGLALSFGCDGGGDDDDDSGDDDSGDDDYSEPGGPEVTIYSPEDGVTIVHGTEIAFVGEAIDPEEGSLPDENLVWESNIDGVIGTGRQFVKSDLSPGQHEIKLTATDSEGKVGWAIVNIFLNQAPSCNIVAPAANERFLIDEDVVFQAEASDPEDGTIPDENISWYSDIDGELGTGATLTKSDLSEGDHIITLQVTDSKGAMCFSGVHIVVTEGKEWTILVYLDADNNLDTAGDEDISEMQTVGSNDYFDIVVLFDRAQGWTSGKAKLLRIMQGYSEELEDLGTVNMGDPETLINFATNAIAQFPAKRYALILWDHGSGWSDKDEPPPIKGICWDDHPGTGMEDYLTNEELDYALGQIAAAAGGKIDIIGFDACLMQCVEIAHYIADSGKYVVASEETEPWDGWAYHRFLSDLNAQPDMSPLELATAIVDGYYVESSSDDTLSALDLSKMDDVVNQVNNFATELMDCNCNSTLKSIASNTQDFYYSFYKDFYDFARLVESSGSLPSSLRSAATEMMNTLDDFIAYNRSYYTNAYGVSIYIPAWDGYDSDYSDLPWAEATLWDEFVQQLD